MSSLKLPGYSSPRKDPVVLAARKDPVIFRTRKNPAYQRPGTYLTTNTNPKIVGNSDVIVEIR